MSQSNVSQGVEMASLKKISPFDRKVYEACKRIPKGKRRSSKEINVNMKFNKSLFGDKLIFDVKM